MRQLTVVEVLWRNAWSIVQCMHMLTCRHLKHSYVSPCRSIHSLCTDHVELRFRVHTCTGVIGPEARCTQSVHCLFRDAWC